MLFPKDPGMGELLLPSWWDGLNPTAPLLCVAQVLDLESFTPCTRAAYEGPAGCWRFLQCGRLARCGDSKALCGMGLLQPWDPAVERTHVPMLHGTEQRRAAHVHGLRRSVHPGAGVWFNEH